MVDISCVVLPLSSFLIKKNRKMKKSTKKILKKLIRNEFDRIPDEIHTEKQSLQLISVALELGFNSLSEEMLQDLR